MIGRRVFAGAVVALAGAGILAGCGANPMQWDEGFYFVPHRFVLKAEIETPEGTRTGSSVIEVKFGHKSYKITGEAVAVDLPKGQTLFVLLRSAQDVDWASNAHKWIGKERLQSWRLAEREGGPDWAERGAYFWGNVADYRGMVPVPRLWTNAPGDKAADNYPYFVRFRDVRDPKSVEQVDPDNLAKSFGPGYRLKSLTVTFTDAPATRGIEKRLGWLADPETRFADPTRDPKTGYLAAPKNPTIANFINSGDFRKDQ